MPYRDPAMWRALGEHVPAIVGGFLAAVLHLFVAFAGPRPWPPGALVKAFVEAVLALVTGVLCAIFIGPLVAHVFKIEAAEAVGGVKVIVGVFAWKALPGIRDALTGAITGFIKRKSESL